VESWHEGSSVFLSRVSLNDQETIRPVGHLLWSNHFSSLTVLVESI